MSGASRTAAGSNWGWRTNFDLSDTGLGITAWTVSPDGEESIATQCRYSRP